MRLNPSALAALGALGLASACGRDSSGPSPSSACGAPGTQLSLVVAAYVSLDPVLDSGCVTFAANSSSDTAEYLVLAQSAGGAAGSFAPFDLASASPSPSGPAPSFAARQAQASRGGSANGHTAVTFDMYLRSIGRAGRYPPVPLASPPVVSVPPRPAPTGPPALGSARTFKVCSNMSCSALANVGATVRAVGAHIAIYVDTLAPAGGLDSADYDALKQVFDTLLYPLDTATFGSVSDVDANTVVMVLMSNVVNRLVSNSRCISSGYIAGFFFPGDLDPGFAIQFNNGEVFYSIVADPGGTLSCSHSTGEVKNVMPVTFTHEFQHMINFVQHVRIRGGDSEEGWLDEGLSKYAEEIAGRAFLPGDPASFSRYAIGSVYDAYQYLLDPGSSPLLIPADTGTLAEVGASWLFVRYLVDQFGVALPGQLVQTAQRGAANVSGRTGQPFAQTVSRWGLANWVSDLPGFAAPIELQFNSWHFRATFGSLHDQDAAHFPLAYPLVPLVSNATAVDIGGTLWSGSGEYVRVVQPPGGATFTLHLSANGTAPVSNAVVPRLNIVRIR